MGTAEPKRCLGCGYILEYLPEPRCPECGRRFNPRDPGTYLTRRQSGQTCLRLALGCVGGLTAAIIGACITTGNGSWTRWAELLTGILVFGGLLVTVALVFVSAEALHAPPDTIRHRRSFAAAFALAGLLACSFGTLALLLISRLLRAVLR